MTGHSPSVNPMSLEGKRILVTGASSGIGQATAILASELGATVICVGRRMERLDATLSTLEGSGHSAEILDLSEPGQLPARMVEICERSGVLHGMVHAGGIQLVRTVSMLEESDWRDILRVNAESALALAKGFRLKRVFAGQSGSIVYISSAVGQIGAAGLAAYSMSKGALNALGRSLACELAREGIRVNSIAPGMVRTPMFDGMKAFWSETQQKAVESRHLLGYGSPADVAAAAVFLLGNAARWITGCVWNVDGGYTAC